MARIRDGRRRDPGPRLPLPGAEGALPALQASGFGSEHAAGALGGLPHRKRKDEASPETRYDDAIADVSRALGVPVLDAGDLGLATRLQTNESYFIDPLHMSPSGNGLMGRLMARQLMELGIV